MEAWRPTLPGWLAGWLADRRRLEAGWHSSDASLRSAGAILRPCWSVTQPAKAGRRILSSRCCRCLVACPELRAPWAGAVISAAAERPPAAVACMRLAWPWRMPAMEQGPGRAAHLAVAAVLDVLLPVQEPVGDLVGAGVGHDGHDALQLLSRQLARAATGRGGGGAEGEGGRSTRQPARSQLQQQKDAGLPLKGKTAFSIPESAALALRPAAWRPAAAQCCRR